MILLYVVYFIALGGLLLLAIVFMVLATIYRASLSSAWAYSSLALLCIGAQFACWYFITEFGDATGGKSGNEWLWITIIALHDWIIWLVLLLALPRRQQKLATQASDEKLVTRN
jgi:hypothetical protein